ncbi:MAG: L-2-amino-thiazoline-4-carboxylic acid hydrolase [Anaerolineales bacterium]|nr:L-2-amino-thiazoline-4-carboxylic acid hydrolase [Anaerolineales bacterium]MBS3753314.1 L-2-amino-thiazoline-4-carboxylic acid hydrolase [Anaerolineales bacterium]
MKDRQEGQKEETKLVSEVRKAIEHRATWMYLLLKEARKRGLDWDDFAREAVRETGCFHGQLRREKMDDPTSMEEFSTVFAAGTSRDVFEMEVLEADEDRYHLDFHYCPLVSAWEKQGASPEEIEQLCDIAMDGDRGIASQFPAFEFTLGKTLAQGHPVCQIRFDKKDPESE